MDLIETAQWVPVTRLETSDAVLGGATGPSNAPLQDLTDRTAWLKQLLEEHIAQQAAALPLLLPVGSILPFAGAVAPTGFLIANGAAVSRTDYAALFALIGTTFGEGNGTTTFNLPNLTDRFPVGAGTAYALGAKGGAATHTLTVEEIPPHTHKAPTSNGGAGLYEVGVEAHGYDYGTQAAPTTSTGGGQAFGILPPYLGLKFVIKH